MLCEVCGARTQASSDVPDTRHMERAVWKLGDTDCHVYALFGQIHHAVQQQSKAPSISAIPMRHHSKNNAPSSVSRTLRVVRMKSWTPSLASNDAIVRDTIVGETLSRRPAFAKACGLIHPAGLRLHLIYNGTPAREGNVLLDAPDKWPGYTHAAFIIESMDDLVAWLEQEGIPISEGPVTMGSGRRSVCFIRDPDRNVLEFNQILRQE